MVRRVGVLLLVSVSVGWAFVMSIRCSISKKTVMNQLPLEEWHWLRPGAEEKHPELDPWPSTYLPDPDYPGTCKPGLGGENAPLSSLNWTNVVDQFDDFSMFEVPFHVRWPSSHPWLDGPYDRLEKAGRFMSDEDIDREIRKGRSTRVKKSDDDGLQVLDENFDEEDEEDKTDEKTKEKDPVFDDTSSSLLDAALGLDDDDEVEETTKKTTKKKKAPAKKAAATKKKTTKKEEGPTFSSPTDYLVD